VYEKLNWKKILLRLWLKVYYYLLIIIELLITDYILAGYDYEREKRIWQVLAVTRQQLNVSKPAWGTQLMPMIYHQRRQQLVALITVNIRQFAVLELNCICFIATDVAQWCILMANNRTRRNVVQAVEYHRQNDKLVQSNCYTASVICSLFLLCFFGLLSLWAILKTSGYKFMICGMSHFATAWKDIVSQNCPCMPFLCLKKCYLLFVQFFCNSFCCQSVTTESEGSWEDLGSVS